MALGKSLDYAMARMTPKQWPEDESFYYPTLEVLILLARHGVTGGTLVDIRHGQVRADDTVRVELSLQDIKAILTVPSPTLPKDCVHYVFWDGHSVRDPDPSVPETTDIEDYNVQSIYPLTYFHEAS
jgi:hypothetical protein